MNKLWQMTYFCCLPGGCDAGLRVEISCSACCESVMISGGESDVQLVTHSKSARLTGSRPCWTYSSRGNCAGPSETSPKQLSSFTRSTGDRCKLLASENPPTTGLLRSSIWLLPSYCGILLSNHCCIQFSPVPVQFWPVAGNCATLLTSWETAVFAALENVFGAQGRYDPTAAVDCPSANKAGGGTIPSSHSILKHQTIFNGHYMQYNEK